MSYYDNRDGSLYLLSEKRGWTSYMFDIVKRIFRGGRKDPLELEVTKTINVIKLMISENQSVFREDLDREPYIGNSEMLTTVVYLLESGRNEECLEYLNSILDSLTT